jgi:1-acyl-sn-glycerol-3-phosphate acyltransferase
LKFLKKIYFIYGMFSFAILYTLLFPFFFIAAQNTKWKRFAFYLNKIWASGFYISTLIPFGREVKGKIDKKKTYVYCPNHTSYLDIPAIGMSAKQFIVFVGKNSLSKVPFFGYMFNRFHIPVDRTSIKASYKAFEQAKEAIDKGRSVLFYPEGGILTKNPPNMTRFKDGAFRIAIEKQVPIVPVTILYNWKILFDFDFALNWHPVKVIYHEPIETTGMEMSEINTLKDQVFGIIQAELTKHFPEKMVEGNNKLKKSK